MDQINTHLDRVRRGYALKLMLDKCNVGRAEFLLEALIFIIECFKEFKPNRYGLFCFMHSGSSVSVLAAEFLMF